MSKEKKPLKRLRTGALSRSLSLARFGLEAGARVAGSALGGILESETAAKARKQALWLKQASRFVAELGELKGSLMKAGQMLSIYGEHFLPPEINELLRTLQSESTPVEWTAMRKALVKSLGKESVAQLEIDPEPCGAASLGQVHRAVVKATGEVLALKIQYPGVDRAIEGDIRVLKKMLSLTEWLPNLPSSENIFAEVKAMLQREVDYDLEREMLEFFAKELQDDPRFVIPRPYASFSSHRVLAMSFEEGVPIGGPEVAALSQPRRDALATALLELFFQELFLWRRVQTDTHFGNFRVRIGKKQDQLVLFDFGAVRDLPEAFLSSYRRMLEGTFSNSRTRFEKAAYELHVLEPDDPPELKNLFYEICLMITEPFLEPQPYDWQGTTLPQRVSEKTWELVKRFPMRAPPREIVFLNRKLAGNFTLLARLGARINGRAILAPYLS